MDIYITLENGQRLDLQYEVDFDLRCNRYHLTVFFVWRTLSCSYTTEIAAEVCQFANFGNKWLVPLFGVVSDVVSVEHRVGVVADEVRRGIERDVREVGRFWNQSAQMEELESLLRRISFRSEALANYIETFVEE